MRGRLLVILTIAFVAVLIGTILYYYLPQSYFVNPETVAEKSVQGPPASAEGVRINFRVLDTGANAASVATRKNYAAYTQESFLRIWGMTHGTAALIPPPVDFSKEYVIGVFAGQERTGGYAIAVSSVVDTGDTRTVAVSIMEPAPHEIVSEGITRPYQIIAVPKSDAALTHADTTVLQTSPI